MKCSVMKIKYLSKKKKSLGFFTTLSYMRKTSQTEHNRSVFITRLLGRIGNSHSNRGLSLASWRNSEAHCLE